MKTFYMKRGFMLLGAAAFVASASAGYVDVTDQYLQEPCYLPAWQGMITAVGEGVGEVWNGAFRLYQVVRDLPAGDYTLTVDASYRCGNNDYARENQEGNPELNTAYIFAGDNKQTVKGLFEGGRQVAPNGLEEANEAFQNGEYVNTLSFKHDGGDLTIGICNTGCYVDEWCAFDNFKLVGPNGEVAIPNGDFSTGIDSKRAWNNVNADNGEKTPDMQKDGAGGGTYRKCGGSPYNYGQQVTLPAGKYRWGMLTFHRYGSTQNPETGEYYHHKSGEVVEPYGRVPRTPKDWFEANDYDAQDYDHAYLYVGFGENKPATLKSEDDFGDLTDKDIIVRIKDVWEICNGNVAEMPDNNPYGIANYRWDDLKDNAEYYASQKKNSLIYWHDSGDERMTAAAFVAEPEKYYQYVEFELPEETTVWVGMGKDSNTSDGYYQPWGYQTIQKYVDEGGEVPQDGEPYYFYSFEDGLNGATIVGGGEIVDEGGKFGKVFQNAKGGMRQNYLQLPEDIFVKTGDTKEFSIACWVNAKNAGESGEYGWCPLFTAYDSNVAGTGCPEFACQYRGSVQVNCNGNDNQGDAWSDYGDELCDQGKVTLQHFDTDWLADNEWHHYTAVFTPTTAAVYFDGKLVNSWTLDGVSSGQRCEFFGDARFNLFCLGGMQAWNWPDPDPAFMFDDVALYNKALNADQIKSIIDAKVGENAVENIQIDANAPVIYYDLQGVQVANPTNGIYIVRQGNKVAKKVIR